MRPLLRFFIFFMCLFTGLSSCEKDDLCDSSQVTTPRLIIRFVENGNTSVANPVPSLEIKEISSNRSTPLNQAGETILTAVDSIAIPLDPNSSTTRYRFIQDNGTTTLTDDIEFTYTPQQVYINRACGFKTDYNNLTTAVTPGSNTWIDNLVIINPSVTNTNETHIEIHH